MNKDVIIVDLPIYFTRQKSIYVIKNGEDLQAIPVNVKIPEMLARAVDLAYSKNINTIQLNCDYDTPLKSRTAQMIKSIEQTRYNQNKIEVI